MRLLVLGSRPELEDGVRATWRRTSAALFFAADPIAALQHAVEDAPDLILIDRGWPEGVAAGLRSRLAGEVATAGIPVASIELEGLPMAAPAHSIGVR